MVRTSQSTTFSASPYFFDRGTYGTAQPITERVNPHSRPVVSYYYPKGVGSHHFGERHPMKPYRLTLTNALVMGYGLDKQIHNMYDSRPATQAELESYHDHDYIDFLSRVTPQNQHEMRDIIDSYNCVEDCPIFADLYDFSRMYTGGSLAGARKLTSGATDIAINWSGGLHHAKRGEASGFCYINDIVVAILELLRYHPRVLYIDIDIHHGDGVELAFYETDRVMTVSFHKYTGDFFPGTGKLDDNGSGPGKHFCLNVPLKDGIDDDMYLAIFKSVIDQTVAAFRPTSIVLQCGADSLGCDRLGAFNLSIKAHGACVDFVRQFNIPMLVVGGGGYTIKNVSRCWTYETAILVGAEIPDELPQTLYDAFFQDSHWKLHPPLTGRVDNENTEESLREIEQAISQKLRFLQGAPSVMMQEIPPDLQGLMGDEERDADERDEEENGTGRAGERRPERRNLVPVNEYYDNDRDVDMDDDTPSTRGRGGARRRAGRPRTGRGGRGSRGGRVAAAARDDSESSDSVSSDTPAPRGRGRGRGRARGGRAARGGRGATSAVKKNSPPTSGSTSAPPSTNSVSAPPSTITASVPPSTITASVPPSRVTVSVPPSTVTVSVPPSAITASAPPSITDAADLASQISTPPSDRAQWFTNPQDYLELLKTFPTD